MKRIFLLLFLLLSFNILAAAGSLDNIRISNLHTKNAAGEINKLVSSSRAWSVNFDMEIIGPVKGGDTYTISSFGPKVKDYITGATYIWGEKGNPFFISGGTPDMVTTYDMKIGQDTIGTLKGNLITFNTNIEKYQNSKVSVSFGLATVMNFNVLKTDPIYGKSINETFYLRINGQNVGNVILDCFPEVRVNLSPVIYNRVRSYIIAPPINGKTELVLYVGPHAETIKIRDNGNWRTDKIKVMVTLPKGFFLKSSINRNVSSRVIQGGNNFLENSNVQVHYGTDGAQVNVQTNSINDNLAVAEYKQLKEPFNTNEGTVGDSLFGTLIIDDLSLINWETGEILGEAIKVDYYLNNVYSETKYLNKIDIRIPKSSLEASGLIKKEPVSEETADGESLGENSEIPKTGKVKINILLLIFISGFTFILYKVYKRQRLNS